MKRRSKSAKKAWRTRRRNARRVEPISLRPLPDVDVVSHTHETIVTTERVERNLRRLPNPFEWL